MHDNPKRAGPQQLVAWPLAERQRYGPPLSYDPRWFTGAVWIFDPAEFDLDPETMRVRLLNAAWRRHLRARTHVAGERLVFQVTDNFYGP